MRKISHVTRLLFLLVLVSSGFALSLRAAHEMKPLDVTVYCQESLTWCGPACAQMAHDTYPAPMTSVFFSQKDLWDCIKDFMNANNSDPTVPWSSDPDGLDHCLDGLAGQPHPPFGQWIIVHGTDYEQVMFDILYLTEKNRYPTPVLVYENHWVLLTGFKTDVSPLTATTAPDLTDVCIANPSPYCASTYTNSSGVDAELMGEGGSHKMLDAAWWKANFRACSSPLPHDFSQSTWKNQYIAIAEPPLPDGRIQPEPPLVTTGVPITPFEAQAAALAAIEDRALCDYEVFEPICGMDVLSEPRLVNHEYEGVLWPELEYGGYYLVPFGYEARVGTVMEGAILINAYTGEFLEVASFGPVPYELLGETFATLQAGTETLSADLIFEYSRQTQNEFLPLIRLWAEGRPILYVDLFSNVYTELTALPPGD